MKSLVGIRVWLKVSGSAKVYTEFGREPNPMTVSSPRQFLRYTRRVSVNSFSPALTSTFTLFSNGVSGQLQFGL
jgi:hypothetical protein